jgi:hypothetical protein
MFVGRVQRIARQQHVLVVCFPCAGGIAIYARLLRVHSTDTDVKESIGQIVVRRTGWTAVLQNTSTILALPDRSDRGHRS